MEKTELTAMMEMLRVSGAAQLLFDGDILAAASPAARRLFPRAEDGATAAEIFGEAAEQLRQLAPGESLLFPVEGPEGLCDVTVTECQGYLLATAAETREAVSAATLRSVAERLRQPMASILAVTPKLLPLLEETSDPGAMERASELNRSLYAILRLTRNLELSGPQDETLALQRSPVNLSVWFQDLTDRVTPLIEAAGLIPVFDVTAEYCPAEIDTAMLERAVLNLLSNAMKFSEPGGKITMSLRQRGRRVMLTVRDQGAGIPPDQMGLIFSRGEHRGPIPDPRWGAGLGLPLARRIVEAHGGRMMLESREGEGTAVHVALPRGSRSTGLLRSPVMVPAASSGVDTTLVELADVLPAGVYDTRGIDL